MGGISLLRLHGRRMALSSIGRKGFCSLSRPPLHVCIVGSGPAGFYTAEKMLKAHDRAQIDIIDRLPTPFGLVRSGVAPDHPETKYAIVHCYGIVGESRHDIKVLIAEAEAETWQQIVINQFSRVASNERCSFFGNVSLGSNVSLAELRKIYDVVVLAYGAESDRSLSIPGEDLGGIYSAREFVWWYNGHPDCCNMTPDFKKTDTAVVLGQGNVALDVARILLRPVTELETTDIADHALASLKESNIRKVYLVGRRGPVQAACTAKELREILGTNNLRVHIDESDLVASPLDEEEIKNNRIKRRVFELLCKAASSQKRDSIADQRELHFKFYRKPHLFLPSEDGCSVGAVRLEKTKLKENGSLGQQIAVGTGEYENLECSLVLKSIGYKSLPVDGLTFDEHRGIVPNKGGRVTNSSDQPEHANVEQGLYVVGWLKRGPTGIIATNLYCAEETVSSIMEDLESSKANAPSPKPGREGLRQILEDRNIRYVPLTGWENIDRKEKMDGQLHNKTRKKITLWSELVRTANE